MELLNKKAINAAILIIVAINLYYFYFKKDKEDDRYERAAEKHESSSEEKIKAGAAKAEELWKKTIVALNEHRLEEAERFYKAGKDKIGYEINEHGYKEIRPGLTLSDWKKEQDALLLEALQEEFRLIIEKLKSAEVTPSYTESFYRTYNDFAFRDLEREYRDRNKEIESARAVLASKWLRINIYDYINGYQYQYGKIIERVLQNKWRDQTGYKLVFARSMGQLEKQATWKTLNIKVEEEDAEYVFGNSNSLNRAPPSIPIKATVSFEMEGDKFIETGWDNLRSLEAEAPAPDSIWVKEKKSDALDEADELLNKNRAKLEKDLTDALESMPGFSFFPYHKVEGMSIFGDDGSIDRKTALAMALTAPDLFHPQFAEAIKSASTETLGELYYLIISLDLNEHAKWLAQSLIEADLNSQKIVIESLKNKPWFWGYGPILFLARRGHDDIRTEALYSLRGQLYETKVKDTIKVIANNSRDARRVEFASLILNEVKKEELGQFAVWIKDRDLQFATQAYNHIRRRDQDLARNLVVKYFPEVSPKLQERMLSGYKINYNSITPGELALLKNAVVQNKNTKMRTNSLNSLLKASHIPEVWSTLNELKTAPLLQEQISQIELQLVYGVDRGNPHNAIKYLDSEILRSQAIVSIDKESMSGKSAVNLQKAAIGKLMEMDGKKDARVTSLAIIIEEYPLDHDFTHNVLFAIQQYHRIRDGWNWDQEELVAILNRGMKHPNPQTRQFTYKTAAYALEKEHRQYSAILEHAQSLETDPKNIKQIEDYLQ